MRTDLDAVCGAKECHDSRETARAEAERLRREGQGRMHVYPCPLIIGKFHVGHAKQNRLRAAFWRRRAREAQYGDGKRERRLEPAPRFTAADRARLLADL